LHTIQSIPPNEPFILANTKDGKTLVMPLDVDAIAHNINTEIDPNLSLSWEIRCYIIESIQYAVFTGNIFS